MTMLVQRAGRRRGFRRSSMAAANRASGTQTARLAANATELAGRARLCRVSLFAKKRMASAPTYEPPKLIRDRPDEREQAPRELEGTLVERSSHKVVVKNDDPAAIFHQRADLLQQVAKLGEVVGSQVAETKTEFGHAAEDLPV